LLVRLHFISSRALLTLIHFRRSRRRLVLNIITSPSPSIERRHNSKYVAFLQFAALILICTVDSPQCQNGLVSSFALVLGLQCHYTWHTVHDPTCNFAAVLDCAENKHRSRVEECAVNCQILDSLTDDLVRFRLFCLMPVFQVKESIKSWISFGGRGQTAGMTPIHVT